jgi:dimethylhistidine N-methyltransferase
MSDQATTNAGRAGTKAGPYEVRESDFARDVREGLLATPKVLPPRYLYDDLGSALFDAICHLPWYRVTRAETQLLERYGPAIGRFLRVPATIVELGPGAGDKLVTLLGAIDEEQRPSNVQLIDVSGEALRRAEQALSRLGGVDVTLREETYGAGLEALAQARHDDGQVLVLFLGSNIGNFDPDEAFAFLTSIRHALRRGDALLLGVDLVKPEADLLAAYDDPLGVTAAFNRNLLVRINRELEGDFDVRAFEHRARWNPAASRMEMHLVSTRPQDVTIVGARCQVRFDEGEAIWTESSYKFDERGIAALVSRIGFRQACQWVARDARFALTLFEVI